MPADPTLSQAPSSRHGDASKPYPCYYWPRPPGAAWSIQHGSCRHSLDVLVGKDDSRCPLDCKHKAKSSVVIGYDKRYHWHGAIPAAKYAKEMHK